LAITDECTMAGIVRAYEAAQETGLKLITGTELTLDDGTKLVLLAADHDGYTDLCLLITNARRRAAKGEYRATRADVEALGAGVLCLWVCGRGESPDRELRSSDGVAAGPQGSVGAFAPPTIPIQATASHEATAAWLTRAFPHRLWLAVELHRSGDDAERLATLTTLGERHGIPLVATGDVHMHVRRRRALQDVITAIRLGCTVAEAGLALFPNGERHLRGREDIAALYPPALLAESVRIAERCTFDLGGLRYQYPHELVPEGMTATEHLRALTQAGAARRWPGGVPASVQKLVDHELALVAELEYEHFFLTVQDIVAWARSQGILCQGRGSAANSAVCFCLGITEVDPARMSMLFERFISKERDEPPDIDVDFEHERREEVIQYVYSKYGRARAAIAATVICYRAKSAIRDVGKALGLSLEQVASITRALSWWDGIETVDARMAERGFDPSSPVLRKLMRLVGELLDFPRHLSQHVGGFVIAEQPLNTLVPVENAAMDDRTIIQWDKDDLETLGLLKVDVLALGMLSCLRGALHLLRDHHRRELTLATIPAEDPQTYEMLQRADSVGVFQVESRAQMAMLPRLKPRNYFDLVVQVAIVRPGPIQGKMVHPYLRRRQQLEPVDYPSEEMRGVFERTLGVPIFQEQVMQLAIVGAGFTPGEADQLRRSMAAWKRRGGLDHFQKRILEGMQARGYPLDFAEQAFEMIRGFGSYGFPESHAASFALLVYASSWLKCHYPAAFACALLNAQPLGFYSQGQIVQDARRHGVAVRPVDVLASDWDSTLEAGDGEPYDEARHGDRGPAIRLGFREIRGMREDAAKRIVAARSRKSEMGNGKSEEQAAVGARKRALPISDFRFPISPFRDVADLAERASLDRHDLECLADAGALRTLAGHRHRARWDADAVQPALPLLEGVLVPDTPGAIRPPTASEDVEGDYARVGYTLGAHPLKLVRRELAKRRCLTVAQLLQKAPGTHARCAGLVTLRQRPQTASGVTFVTMEDETGWLNVVVWRQTADRQRRELLEGQLLAIDGVLEQAEGVSHFIARRLTDYADLLGGIDARSRDFR
ncbi:MAG TPA: error-prone DNA polymerase, partial [Xanthomonadales bacterium]|nr:error-prone DNA polymerase [Xanthomonadales bacterium]